MLVQDKHADSAAWPQTAKHVRLSARHSACADYPDAGVMVDEFFNGIVMRDSTRGPAIKKLEMQRRLEKVQWHAASLRKPVHARKQVIYTILKAAGMSSRHPDRPSR